MKIPEYFTDKEFSCHCGCGLTSPFDVVKLIYAVRLIMGIPIIIKSPIRCKKHNEKEGGSDNSFHLPWYESHRAQDVGALDIIAVSPSLHIKHEYELIRVCQFVGFNGIGIKDNTFLHVDNRITKSIWGYK